MLFYDLVLQLTPAPISAILSHSQPDLPSQPPPQKPLEPRAGQGGPQAVAEVVKVSKHYPLFGRPFDRLRQLWRPTAQTNSSSNHPSNYPSKAALSDISLQIYPGQVFGIVGRNGSGKSTLLRLIAGVVKPSTGEVVTRGRVAALLELGAGFNPEFSGRDNVMISASLLGVDEATTLARMADIEAFADIGEYFGLPVKTYSSGMYARVAFAVMAVCDPDLLILDEILAVGDEAFQRKCLARIEQLAAQGCAIVLVTHNSQLVLEFCETAALIHDGNLVAQGEPKAVIHEYYRRQGSLVNEGASANEPGEKPQETVAPAFLDAELPRSAPVGYGDGGAKISDVHLLDERGERVNVLIRGAHYRFCYRVQFADAAVGVEFGSLIKTRSGIEVGGMLLGGEPLLEQVEAGQTLLVQLPFACRLLPDSYFFNAGVRAQDLTAARAMHYLHRVMDAMMFQVRPEPDLAVTGMVDFSDPARPPSVQLDG